MFSTALCNIIYSILFPSTDYPTDKIEHNGDGYNGNADEVDVDSGLYHLGDRHIATGIDDSIRRGGDGQHEAER